MYSHLGDDVQPLICGNRAAVCHILRSESRPNSGTTIIVSSPFLFYYFSKASANSCDEGNNATALEFQCQIADILTDARGLRPGSHLPSALVFSSKAVQIVSNVTFAPVNFRFMNNSCLWLIKCSRLASRRFNTISSLFENTVRIRRDKFTPSSTVRPASIRC
jgi:hypothetical protein